MGQYTINNIELRAYDLKGDIDNIYRALNTKIKSSPETLDQVPRWILDIPGLQTEEPLTITPSVDRQEFFSTDETKYNPIEVEPVTSAIDSNIQPENIKAGISILGVTGALPGGNAKLEESFDVQPTTADQTITPREGYTFSGGTVHAVTAEIDKNIQSENIKEGVSILGVDGTLSSNAKPEEVFDVQPTTTDQTITPTEGSVFSGGTVRAVTSSIDSNIQPENIKEGVSILGVNGTLLSGNAKPEEVFDVQPTTAEQIIIPREGYVYAGGVVRAVTSAIDNNIQPENIKAGISILGVNGTLSSGGGSDVFVVPPDMRFGNSTFKEVPSYFDFSNMTDMRGMFQNCYSLTTIPPQFVTSRVTDTAAMFSNCRGLIKVPQIDTTNVTSMDSMFNGCENLTTIPQLNSANVNSMKYILGSCTKLKTVEGIDFSGLTSDLTYLFGWDLNKSKVTRFIVNGKINVSISDNSGTKALTVIDYDSVKSILAAADRTDNTNEKTLRFSRTMTDQNGELAALVSSCTSKGWTITGLTIQ